MWFECEQPFLSGERCMTSRKTAAKETNRSLKKPQQQKIAFITARIIAYLISHPHFNI